MSICRVCKCSSYKNVNEVHNGICDYCAVDELNKIRQKETEKVPNLPIIAVFCNSAFIQFEYADHTRSEFIRTTGEEIVRLADLLSPDEWMTLQQAAKNPDQWTPVDRTVIEIGG